MPDVTITELDAGERAEESAGPGLLRQLRPYLPDRHAASSLCSGSSEIWRLAWGWITEKDWKTALERLGCIGAGAYVAVYLDLHHMPFVLPAAAGAWVVTAWYLSPAARTAAVDVDQDDELVDAGDEDDKDQDDDEPPAAPPLDVVLVARLVREIAAERGWAGAHLDELLDRLPGRTDAELLHVLADHGIAVAPQFKVRLPGGGQKNRRGVRLGSLPAGLGEAPQPAPAGPQSAPAPAAAAGVVHSLSKPSPPPLPAPLSEAG